jgi:hypothetical protein
MAEIYDTYTATGTNDDFESEFAALPLEERFARLFRMEMRTLTDAVAYAVNSPMKVVEHVGDMISECGTRLETEFRRAAHTVKSEAKAANERAKAGASGAPRSRASRPPKS